MIGVVATMVVKPDQIETFEIIMKDQMALVKANEPGCLTYQLYKSKKEENTYVMMEEYSSKDALKQHSQTDYAASGMAKLAPCLAAQPDIQLYDMIE